MFGSEPKHVLGVKSNLGCEKTQFQEKWSNFNLKLGRESLKTGKKPVVFKKRGFFTGKFLQATHSIK